VKNFPKNKTNKNKKEKNELHIRADGKSPFQPDVFTSLVISLPFLTRKINKGMADLYVWFVCANNQQVYNEALQPFCF
jgi:hypothetical protein